ncbi:hypothetical protein GCM10027174_19300 [Salinifilum aidingensis]
MSLHRFTVYTGEEVEVCSLDALRAGGSNALWTSRESEEGGALHVEYNAAYLGQAIVESLRRIERVGLTPTGILPSHLESSVSARQTTTAADHLLRARRLLQVSACDTELRELVEYLIETLQSTLRRNGPTTG